MVIGFMLPTFPSTWEDVEALVAQKTTNYTKRESIFQLRPCFSYLPVKVQPGQKRASGYL